MEGRARRASAGRDDGVRARKSRVTRMQTLAWMGAPSGIEQAIRTVEHELAALMDVCGMEARVSNGYAVEDFRDAPMRVRGWFENIEDAHRFAEQFGEHAWVHPADAPYEAAATVAPRLAVAEQNVLAMRERSEKKKIEATEEEIESLEDEIRSLRRRLEDLESRRGRAA